MYKPATLGFSAEVGSHNQYGRPKARIQATFDKLADLYKRTAK